MLLMFEGEKRHTRWHQNKMYLTNPRSMLSDFYLSSAPTAPLFIQLLKLRHSVVSSGGAVSKCRFIKEKKNKSLRFFNKQGRNLFQLHFDCKLEL